MLHNRGSGSPAAPSIREINNPGPRRRDHPSPTPFGREHTTPIVQTRGGACVPHRQMPQTASGITFTSGRTCIAAFEPGSFGGPRRSGVWTSDTSLPVPAQVPNYLANLVREPRMPARTLATEGTDAMRSTIGLTRGSAR